MIHIVIKSSDYTLCGKHLDHINRSDRLFMVDGISGHLFNFYNDPERCMICMTAAHEEIDLVLKKIVLDSSYDDDNDAVI